MIWKDIMKNKCKKIKAKKAYNFKINLQDLKSKRISSTIFNATSFLVNGYPKHYLNFIFLTLTPIFSTFEHGLTPLGR